MAGEFGERIRVKAYKYSTTGRSILPTPERQVV